MEGKKKRKNYFSNQGNDQKKRKRMTLECGMKGFLCTCNFREKDCVREAYNLLNEYAEKIGVPEDKQTETELDSKKKNEESITVIEERNTETKEVDDGENREDEKSVNADKKNADEEDENEDISAALNKELDELKTEAVKPLSERKFQAVDTGVSNVIFIKSTIPDTLELLMRIIKDMNETKKQKTRYLLRMLPIQVSCKAYMDDIKSKADILFERYFSQEPKTFSIVFNRHSNSNLQRTELIDELAQLILKKNPGNKANLKNPEIAVVVEVVRAVCLLSIAPQYFTFKKYNLLEICNQNK